MNEMTFGRVSDLNGLPQLIVSYGGESALERALERQSLPFEILGDREAVILMKDIIGLYRNAADVTGLRSFGLQVADGVDLSDYGIFADFVLQSKTLKEAIFKFQNGLPYYESGSSVTVLYMEHECTIGYQNTFQGVAGFRQAGDMTLRIIEAIIRAFLGPDWRPNRLKLACSPGRWEQDYEDAFSAPVYFRSDCYGFAVDRDQFEQTRASAPLKCPSLVTISDLQHLGRRLPQDFAGTVARILRIHLSDGKFRLEDTAKSLALGPRTLQRRLEEYGIGYRDLLERVRMQRACELLRETDATVSTISKELGYAATSHFSRAFSRAFEVSPSVFRDAQAVP